MAKKHDKDAVIEYVATSAALVLSKFGERDADYTEWRTLKDDLLKLHAYLPEGYAKERVGFACSSFNRARRKFDGKPVKQNKTKGVK